jgi:N-acetylmuramoyl-L-alanine amidase
MSEKNENNAVELAVAHCSDSNFGNAAFLTKCHILPKPRGRGWSNIGYHYIILNGQIGGQSYNPEYDGIVETGRPLDTDGVIQPWEFGAHALGYNKKSIGFCLIGIRDFTLNQYIAMEELCKNLIERYPKIKIAGHYQLDTYGKTCPNIDMPAWLTSVGLKDYIYEK